MFLVKSYPTGDRIHVRPYQAQKSMADTILNRYEIKDLLARSGFGVIYRAFDSQSGQDVAVKTVSSASAGNPSVLRNEWQILERLHHNNVIGVYDFGEFKSGGETVPFIVMPLLQGHTLDQLIGTAGKPLDSAVVVDVMDQVCQGLQYTHEQEIVHRNIKPSHIFITTENYVKLIGFGLARDLKNESQKSPSGGIIGTILYMAPEQVQGLAATVDTDIFCLGAVCYEALTGRRPFDGPNTAAVLLAILREDPTPLVSIKPDLGNGLSLAVQKVLAKRAEERYPSAEQFAEAIRRAIVATNS